MGQKKINREGEEGNMLWSEFVHACTEMKSLQVKPPACPFPRFAGYQRSFLLCGFWKAERKRGLKGRNSFVYLSPLPTDRTEFCSVFRVLECLHRLGNRDTHTYKHTCPHYHLSWFVYLLMSLLLIWAAKVCLMFCLWWFSAQLIYKLCIHDQCTHLYMSDVLYMLSCFSVHHACK